MKRFIAYIIDYLIMAIILCFLNLILFKNIRDINLRWGVVCIYIYMFFWLNDFVFKGSSIGKKIMKMKIDVKGDSVLLFATIHSSFKIFFSFIWAISLAIFFIKNKKMPYDNLLYNKID